MAEPVPSVVDVVIVGSGAAALAGAVTAAAAGLSVLILESTACWGGTSACSGGGVWIPNNPLMRDHGIEDSREAALAYLDRVIGDGGPSATKERQEAFVDSGPPMVSFLRDLGMRWEFTVYPDYYPSVAGARDGRGLACPVINGRELGQNLATLRRPKHVVPVVFKRSEFLALLAPLRRKRHLLTLARIALRTVAWRVKGGVPLMAGQGTMAELMRLAQANGASLLLEAEVQGFERVGHRVEAVLFRCGERDHRLLARKAIVIASGGYSRGAELRRCYQPVGDDFTTTAPGDIGMPIAAAMAIGADVALMNESWWMPSVRLPDGSNAITLTERSLPHSLIVDQTARRYLNEAQPYCDCGRAMLDHAGATFSWLIMDSRHRRRYAFTHLAAGQTPQAWIDGGHMVRAGSISELAQRTGLDRSGLEATLARFNCFARAGRDEDFGRGSNRFDNGWGDPWQRPNPNLGTIEKPPFFAIKIWPGDLGTKGGLLTDADGRVIGHDGTIIEGLYAAGNASATMMGRCYPGPGATLGAGMVFAFRAMRHAADAFPDQRVNG